MSDGDLITGATGCLGSNIVERLVRDGVRPVIFMRYGETLGRLRALIDRFEIRFGDVRDPDSVRRAMQGIRRVYHFAGIAVPSNRLEREMWDVNVVGVYNVVSAAARARVQRVVHVSSTAAIGYPSDGVVANEDFDPADSEVENAYSLTKRRGEQIARGFDGAGTEVVVVNPAAVIAPGGDTRYGWSGVVLAAKRGLLRVLPHGGSAFCSDTDLVEGVLGAMRAGKPGERYILSSQNLKYTDVARLVAEVVGKPRPRLVAPGWLLRALGRINDWNRLRPNGNIPILVPENIELMTRTLYYDQSKAVRQLGIGQTQIVASIRRVNEWLGGTA